MGLQHPKAEYVSTHPVSSSPPKSAWDPVHRSRMQTRRHPVMEWLADRLSKIPSFHPRYRPPRLRRTFGSSRPPRRLFFADPSLRCLFDSARCSDDPWPSS
jgi:hypothetical protein